jgi:hypothetical protein
MQINDFAPLSGVIGALLGAGATYLLTLRTESKKNYSRLRSDAYIDFIKSTSGLAIAQKLHNSGKASECSEQITDAKVRIAIYGSRAVAEALAEFFRDHSVINSQKAIASFIHVVDLMRAETPGGKEKLSQSAFELLLFGKAEE